MPDQIPQVQFTEPPIEMQETIIKHVQPFADLIPEGKVGGVFAVLSKDNSGRMISNAVLAVKIHDTMQVSAYIGKTWGKEPLVYGVEAKFFF